MSPFPSRTLALLAALLLFPAVASAQPTLLDAIAHILDAGADGFLALRGEQTLGGPLPRWEGTYRIPGTQATMYCSSTSCSYSLLHDPRPSADEMHRQFAAFQEAYPDWIAVPNERVLPTGPMAAFFDCGPVTRAVVLGGVAASVTVGEAPGYLPPACEGQVAAAPPRPQPEAASPTPGRIVTTCVSGDCTSGTGTATYTRDGALLLRYTGAFLNGKPHGQGRYVDDEGEVFEGIFADGAEVRGTATYTNGNVYVGEYAGSTRHGQGTMTYASGNRYEGEWQEGDRHGRGTFVWADGHAYDGQWHQDRRHGRGTFTSTDGSTFTGDWVDDVRVRGREVYASGNVYEGEYTEGRRHGQGTMTYASGNRYEGQWQNNQRHGQGTFTWTSGGTFVGEWANDARVHGRETMVDGAVYEGEYADDKLHGQGTYTYADGRVQAGRWEAGVFVGASASSGASGGSIEADLAVLNETIRGRGGMGSDSQRLEYDARSGRLVRINSMTGDAHIPPADVEVVNNNPTVEIRCRDGSTCISLWGGAFGWVGEGTEDVVVYSRLTASPGEPQPQPPHPEADEVAERLGALLQSLRASGR